MSGDSDKPLDNSLKPKMTAILWLPVACPSCGNNQATPPRLDGEDNTALIDRLRKPMDVTCHNCAQPITAVFVGDNSKG